MGNRRFRLQALRDFVPEGPVHPFEIGGPVPDLTFQIVIGFPGPFVRRLALEIGRQHLGERLNERPLLLQKRPFEKHRPVLEVDDLDQATRRLRLPRTRPSATRVSRTKFGVAASAAPRLIRAAVISGYCQAGGRSATTSFRMTAGVLPACSRMRAAPWSAVNSLTRSLSAQTTLLFPRHHVQSLRRVDQGGHDRIHCISGPSGISIQADAPE